VSRGLEVEEAGAEKRLRYTGLMIDMSSHAMNGGILTAVNVAGRKIIVTTAIVRIAPLSSEVARATIFESSAIAFIAALSLWLASDIFRVASAFCNDAAAVWMFRALSFCAMRL
jgi:hypothetical protein